MDCSHADEGVLGMRGKGLAGRSRKGPNRAYQLVNKLAILTCRALVGLQ